MAAKWWAHLEGCDPISQEPLRNLQHPPFELGGPKSNGAGKSKQRLATTKSGQFYEARLLASYMVSSGKFECPVTRRTLTRGECAALDDHITKNGLGEGSCLAAWTLARQLADGCENDRARLLRREAAAVLESLLGYGPSVAALALGNSARTAPSSAWNRGSPFLQFQNAEPFLVPAATGAGAANEGAAAASEIDFADSSSLATSPSPPTTTTTTTMMPESLVRCSFCSCALPSHFFSKSQRKKALASMSRGGELNNAKCSPCAEGVAQLLPPPVATATKADEYFCLTMHQPWASLVVAGIKRLEGRSWLPDNFSHGILWIHAAAKEPDPEDIELVEAQYKLIYALDGVSGIDVASALPRAYPTSCLLGCVNVTAVLARGDLQRLNLTPALRAESEAEFVFLCQHPQRLVLPRAAVSGHHKVWRLSKADASGVTKGLASTVNTVASVDFRALFPKYIT